MATIKAKKIDKPVMVVRKDTIEFDAGVDPQNMDWLYAARLRKKNRKEYDELAKKEVFELTVEE